MSIHLDPDKCLACTTCVVHCPVAAATPAFLGPRMIGPAFERFRLLGILEDESLTYCANCKNCEIYCPQNVPVATINMLARLEQCKEVPPSFRDWVVAHGEVIARALAFVPAQLKNFGMDLAFVRTILDWIGIAKESPMPKFAQQSFRTHIQHIEQPKSSKQVAFFPGCYINYYDPGTGFDLVSLLNRAGYTVLVPKEFVCCGIPLISGGFAKDAQTNAKINSAALAQLAKDNIPVLTACPSCRLMLTREMPEFFPDLVKEPLEVLDAQQFLLNLIAGGELALPEHGPSVHILYHAPCHLRVQGDGLPGFDLLRSCPDIRVTNANAGCCGISGSYGFKKEKYAIGQRVGEQLFSVVRAQDVALVASECGTCRLQITGATKKRTVHPVSIVRALIEGKDFPSA